MPSRTRKAAAPAHRKSTCCVGYGVIFEQFSIQLVVFVVDLSTQLGAFFIRQLRTRRRPSAAIGEPDGIDVYERVTTIVSKGIQPTLQPNRVALDIATERRIVVAEVVVVERATNLMCGEACRRRALVRTKRPPQARSSPRQRKPTERHDLLNSECGRERSDT
jgi:hypothetical protein